MAPKITRDELKALLDRSEVVLVEALSEENFAKEPRLPELRDRGEQAGRSRLHERARVRGGQGRLDRGRPAGGGRRALGRLAQPYVEFRLPPMGYEVQMSIIDKITGRAKKAAGDITGDPSMRSQGRREERKGEEKEKLAEAQDRADEKAQDVADLERRT
jgi:uncharacterized protein YjbJ (UPF0337 family)